MYDTFSVAYQNDRFDKLKNDLMYINISGWCGIFLNIRCFYLFIFRPEFVSARSYSMYCSRSCSILAHISLLSEKQL